MASKSGRLARSSAILRWSASRSVSSGAEKIQPRVAWIASVFDGSSSPAIGSYGGTPVHLAPERVVHLLRGEARRAHTEDPGDRRVEVAVAAEAPDDLGVARRRTRRGRRHRSAPARRASRAPRTGSRRGSSGRGDRPGEHLADVAASSRSGTAALGSPSQIHRSGLVLSAACRRLPWRRTLRRWRRACSLDGGRPSGYPGRAGLFRVLPAAASPRLIPRSTRRALTRPQEDPHDEP